MKRHIRTTAAAVVILLCGGATAAVAQGQPKDNQLPPAAAEARGGQLLKDHGKPGVLPPANETSCENVRKPENLKALKAKGVKHVECQQWLDKAPPETIEWANNLTKDAEVPPANFPQPTGNGEMQVNGLAPYTDEIVGGLSQACVGKRDLGLTTLSRTQACQLYGFWHHVIRTQDGANIGNAYFSLMTWQDLNPRSRLWHVGHAIEMLYADGVAVQGINTYFWSNCRAPGLPCEKTGAVPADEWVLVKPNQLMGGRTHFKSTQAVVDRSHAASAMWTFSTVPGAQNIAKGETPAFMEIRCDRIDYLAQNSGEGCVYGAFAGTLTLRISDSTMTESAAWVREAQQRFATHPGLRGWQPLHRSFPYELDANRAISGPVCNKLPKKDGQQCDEYPFAATREGAAFGPQGTYWDVKAVNGDHNQKVGWMLGSMYSNERYFYGDTFYVDVLN